MALYLRLVLVNPAIVALAEVGHCEWFSSPDLPRTREPLHSAYYPLDAKVFEGNGTEFQSSLALLKCHNRRFVSWLSAKGLNH